METESVGLRIDVSMEGQWVCDHCKTFYPYRKRKLQAFARADDPLFHRALDFCLSCAKIVAEKFRQLVGLWESVKEEDPHVVRLYPDQNTDGIEYGRTLGGKGKAGEESAKSDEASAPVDPAQPGLFEGL